MITSTFALTISASDGVSGNSPLQKIVSGLTYSGTDMDYRFSQQIGVAPPTGLVATAYTSGGFLPANTYYYRVTGLNGTGETTGSNEVSVTTTGSTSAVNLSWSSMAGATSYRVYRGTTAGAESLYFTVTSPTYTATGAWANSGTVPGSNTTQLSAPGTVTPTGSTTGGTLAAATYYYKVTALNAVGETTGSTEASVTTTGSTSSVALAWAAVTGATSYRIYRGTAAGSENVYYTSATNAFTDTGATGTAGTVPVSNTTQVSAPGTITAIGSSFGGYLPAGTYYYKITATNQVGETTGSTEASVTLSTSGSSISLTWAAVTGATGYKIYRGGSSGGENVYVAVTTNSFNDITTVSTNGTVPTSNTTGTTWTPTLSQTPLQVLYLRNQSSANNATIAWTPTGGGSATVAVLAPNGAIALLEPITITGGGITAFTVTMSAPGSVVEGFWVS